MATKVKIEFNSDGFKEILESEGVKQLVTKETEKIAERANAKLGKNGYKAVVNHSTYGGGRWRGRVIARNDEANEAESESKTLTSSIK